MYNVAVVGATGAVGEEMLKILEERNFPVASLLPLASERSLGKTIEFKEESIPVQVLDENSLDDIDVALFSAGSEVSREFIPGAAKKGTLIIDNSPAFRRDEDVPLAVPEVNPSSLDSCERRIIANPNCVVIQLAVALYPLHQAATIKRLTISTYQATSGAGRMAMDELSKQTIAMFSGGEIKKEIFPKEIAFNCLPSIGTRLSDGITSEEEKIMFEIPKIFGAPKIKVSATAVRVPVFCGHGACVSAELDSNLAPETAMKILESAPGIVLDDLPTNRDAAGKNEVFVGRVRKDTSLENGILMWVTADNLRKGAALNAVQLAELAIKKEII